MLVHRVPTISTSHVTLQGYEWLESTSEMLVFTARHEGYGLWVYMDEEPENILGMPECVLTLVQWARREGRNFDYIRLDSCGDTVELPIHQWE